MNKEEIKIIQLQRLSEKVKELKASDVARSGHALYKVKYGVKFRDFDGHSSGSTLLYFGVGYVISSLSIEGQVSYLAYCFVVEAL